MLRRHEKIYSPAIGKDMNVIAYGHFGMPVLAYASAKGKAWDWEGFKMVEQLEPWIDQGLIKVYCTDSLDGEAWLNSETHPAERALRQRAFEDYIINNLVPAIRADCKSPEIKIMGTGCSFGGYHACNLALKFPEIFNIVLCMSGRYDIGHFTDRYYNDDVYFSDPLAYFPGMDGSHLERIKKHTHYVMVVGQGPYEEGCIEETDAMCRLFSQKDVSHVRDFWGLDVEHNWNWWRKMLRHHFARLVHEGKIS